MPKFTQQELEEAYSQMSAERIAEYNLAFEASNWLKKELGLGNVWAWSHHSYPHSRPSPLPNKYFLKLIHETYGPYKEDYIKKLDSSPWAKKIDESTYEVTTPHGVYKTKFEYFDNHYAGY